MRSCTQQIESFRRDHRNIKSESIKHQVIIVFVQRRIVYIRQKSDYFKLSATDIDLISDVYLDVACVHPVNRDLVLVFRRTSFVERSKVNFIFAAEHSDSCISSSVTVIILVLILEEMLVNSYGNRHKIRVIKIVFFNSLIPLLINSFYHFFMSFSVGIFNCTFELFRIPRFFQSIVVILFYGGIDLSFDHFLISDPVSFALGPDCIFNAFGYFFFKLFINSLRNFYICFFITLIDEVLSYIGFIPFFDCAEKFF